MTILSCCTHSICFFLTSFGFGPYKSMSANKMQTGLGKIQQVNVLIGSRKYLLKKQYLLICSSKINFSLCNYKKIDLDCRYCCVHNYIW